MERLDKFLSDHGAGTRSQVRQLLKAGRVRVDGIAEADGGRKIDPQKQTILLDGIAVRAEGTVVLMMNKPAGYVTATYDPIEKTVMELLPEPYRRMELNPVGRLDKQTEGLLLFTNDGELLHRLISPKREIQKVYFARHEGIADEDAVRAFASGLTLKDGTVCKPAILEPLEPGESRITVCEGKYHQVRRMMASLGMHVTALDRVQEGFLVLNDLPRGAVRPLTEAQIARLKADVGIF